MTAVAAELVALRRGPVLVLRLNRPHASGTIPRIPLNLVRLKGVQILGFQFVDFARHAPGEFDRNDAELAELLASHRVLPHIGAGFPLGEVAAALRLVADGGAIGKVVLDIGDLGAAGLG